MTQPKPNHLASVPGGPGARMITNSGRGQPPGAVASVASIDPDPPVYLRDAIERWSRRKAVRLADGRVLHLPWVAIQVLEEHTEAVIHPIDYLPLDEIDVDLIAREIWDKGKAVARRHDNGARQGFIARCWFADIESEDRTFDTKTFEDQAFDVTLPRERAQWGEDRAYIGSKYGRPLSQHAAPWRAEGEIVAMDMALQIMREAVQGILSENQSMRRSEEDRRKHDKEMLERERNVRRMEREEKWEDAKQEMMIEGGRHLFGRLGKIGPVAIGRLSAALTDKLSKKPKRIGVERQSFNVITTLIRKAKAKAERQAKEAGVDGFEFTMPMLLALLKGQFDIDEDDPIVADVIEVVLEVEHQRIREEVEAEARMPGVGEIVIEPKSPQGSKDE